MPLQPVSMGVLLLASLLTQPPDGHADIYGDPLPPGAVVRLGTTQLRPGGNQGIWLLYTPDGKRLISCNDSGLLLMWDVARGKFHSKLPGEPLLDLVDLVIS